MNEWLVGKKAVANALGVSVSTVKRYLKRYPDFPANRRGGTIYVSPEALRAWVERGVNKKCPMCGITAHYELTGRHYSASGIPIDE